MTRLNYVNWKRNLDIVLTTKGYKYILIEECPNLFTTNALRLERERYKKWVNDDEMARCYILVSMSSILQHHLKDHLSSTNMIVSLKKMFEEQGYLARQIAMIAKMTEETLKWMKELL